MANLDSEKWGTANIYPLESLVRNKQDNDYVWVAVFRHAGGKDNAAMVRLDRMPYAARAILMQDVMSGINRWFSVPGAEPMYCSEITVYDEGVYELMQSESMNHTPQ